MDDVRVHRGIIPQLLAPVDVDCEKQELAAGGDFGNGVNRATVPVPLHLRAVRAVGVLPVHPAGLIAGEGHERERGLDVDAAFQQTPLLPLLQIFPVFILFLRSRALCGINLPIPLEFLHLVARAPAERRDEVEVRTVHLVRVRRPRRGRQTVSKALRILFAESIDERLLSDTRGSAEGDDPRRRVIRHPTFAEVHGGQRVLGLVLVPDGWNGVGERVQQPVVKRALGVVQAEILLGPSREPRHHRYTVRPHAVQHAVVLHQLERRLAQQQRPQLYGPSARKRRAAEDVDGHPVVDPHAPPLVDDPHSHRVLAVRADAGVRRVLRVAPVVVLGPDVLPQKVPGVDHTRALVHQSKRVPHPLRRGIGAEEDAL